MVPNPPSPAAEARPPLPLDPAQRLRRALAQAAAKCALLSSTNAPFVGALARLQDFASAHRCILGERHELHDVPGRPVSRGIHEHGAVAIQHRHVLPKKQIPKKNNKRDRPAHPSPRRTMGTHAALLCHIFAFLPFF